MTNVIVSNMRTGAKRPPVRREAIRAAIEQCALDDDMILKLLRLKRLCTLMAQCLSETHPIPCDCVLSAVPSVTSASYPFYICAHSYHGLLMQLCACMPFLFTR